MLLYKYRDFSTEFWKSIFNNDGEFWLSVADKLDDEEEIKVVSYGIPMPKDTKEHANSLRNSVSLLSLSKTMHSEDCWTRYAEDKKGLCIEIDFTDYDDQNGHYPLFPVDYITEPAILRLGLIEILQYIVNGELPVETAWKRLFLEKNISWADQEEFRVMHHNNTPEVDYTGHAKSFGIERIKKVYYFSNKIAECNLNELNELIKQVEDRTGHQIRLVPLD